MELFRDKEKSEKMLQLQEAFDKLLPLVKEDCHRPLSLLLEASYAAGICDAMHSYNTKLKNLEKAERS